MSLRALGPPLECYTLLIISNLSHSYGNSYKFNIRTPEVIVSNIPTYGAYHILSFLVRAARPAVLLKPVQ